MTAVHRIRPRSAAAPAPAYPAPPSRTRPPLHVVPRRRPSRQVRRRRGRLLIAGATVLLAMGMLAVVGSHVLLTQRQFRLDAIDQQLAQAQASHDQLALQVAELSSPRRIVSSAEQRLHMVVPPQIVYLAPGAPSGTKVRSTPASTSTGPAITGQASPGLASTHQGTTQATSGTAAARP